MKNWFQKFGAIALITLPAIATAQNITYHIKGQIGHLAAPAKAYLDYYDDSRTEHLDSAIIKDGSFTISGTSDHPRPITIVVNKKGNGVDQSPSERISLYMESGDIVVTSPDSIQNATISGGRVNAENNQLSLALKTLNDEMTELSKTYQTAPAVKKNSQPYLDSLTNRSREILAQEAPIYLAFAKANPSSFVGLFAVINYGNINQDAKDIDAAFNSLSPEIRGSSRGLIYAIVINEMKKTAVGSNAPDFTLADSTGKAISLHDFKGKYVLVDFWASWCVPCRRENPNVLKAYNAYNQKNFTVLGISLDSKGAKNAWLKAIHDDHLPWTQLCSLTSAKNDAAQLYNIQTIPQNFLVGPDGKIVAINLRGKALINKLQQVLDK